MNIPSIKSFGTNVWMNSLFVLVLFLISAGVVIGQGPEAQPPNLDQCRNGAPPAPPEPCAGTNWTNGNVGAANSQWVEGQFAPYRVIITELAPNEVRVGGIQWDTTEGDSHALDYIGTYNETDVNANPCPIADCGTPTTFTIPLDPRVANAGVTQIPGEFYIWGGTILYVGSDPTGLTGAGEYIYEGPADYSDTTTAGLYIRYQADTDGGTVVIAWSGHISSRADWGLTNTAAGIQGSSYHMRIFGGGGNQDRSMSVGGVIFPALIEIRKSVETWWGAVTSPQSFPFTSTNTFLNTVTDVPITSFNLVDNVVDPEDPGTHNQVGKVLSFGTTVRFEEGQVLGWGPSDVICERFDAGFGTDVGLSTFSSGIGTVQPFTPAFADITVQEGAGVRCTFFNLQGEPTAAEVSAEGRVVGTNGRGLAGITVILTNASDGTRETAVTNTFGFFKFEGLTVLDLYTVTAIHKRYTFNELTFAPDDNVSGLTLTATAGTLR